MTFQELVTVCEENAARLGVDVASLPVCVRIGDAVVEVAAAGVRTIPALNSAGVMQTHGRVAVMIAGDA